MENKKLVPGKLFKKFVLIGATSLILVSWGLFIWQYVFQPSVVNVELVKGEVSLIRRFDTIRLDSNNSTKIYSGDVLKIPENSAILLVFSNGQNVLLDGQKELVLNSSSKFGNDQLYVFQDQISGRNFNYSIKFGLDKASAAVVASKNELSPNVLGVYDKKLSASEKYALFNKIQSCLVQKESLLQKNFNYNTELKTCLMENNLGSLDELK